MKICPTAWIAGALVFAVTAAADARPDARMLRCEQVQSLIQNRRAAVLTTGQNTYDRYVRQFGNECDWPEVPTAASISTRDGQCRVYLCREPVFDFPN